MLIIRDRLLDLIAFEVAVGQLTVQLSGLVVARIVVRFVDLEGAIQGLASLLWHVCSLLSKGEQYILISDFVVELWQHLRLVI